MKKLLFLLLFIPFLSKSQGFIIQTPNTVDSTWSVYEFNTPTSTYGDRIDWIHLSRIQLRLRSGIIKIDSFDNSKDDGVITGGLAWFDANGYLRKSDPSILDFITPTSTNLLTNKSGNISQWTNNVGYLTSINSSMVTTALGYTPINPNGSSLQYIRGDGTFATFPSRSQSIETRSFNSSFQVSETYDSEVKYTVQIQSSLSISGGQTGTVFLEYSPNDSDWTEISRLSNGNTGTLTIGINTTQTIVGQISGYIPSGYYVRLRTSSSGSPTITYIIGQEITY